MIDLIKFRQLLGPIAHDLSDEEVERIRETEYGLVDAIFERWLRKRNVAPSENAGVAKT